MYSEDFLTSYVYGEDFLMYIQKTVCIYIKLLSFCTLQEMEGVLAARPLWIGLTR